MRFKIRHMLLVIIALQAGSGRAETESPNTYQLRAESGFLGVQNHRIMFSEKNTYFDYVEDGGQDTLFSYQRYTVDIIRPDHNQFRLVYQPIDLQTSETLEKDLMVDNVTFASGTPMNFRYSFPYYRATWLWSLLKDYSSQLKAGLGMQIRNATIVFESADGSMQVSNRDVGPVPLFALLFESKISDSTSFVFEAEGNYANTSYINGDDDNAVTGAIIDTAVTLQTSVSEKLFGYSTFRYVSGGAEGKSDEVENPSGDGYNSNWIDLTAFSVGLVLNLNAWR